MEKFYKHNSLVKRFVSDYKLPIPCGDCIVEHFPYFLELYNTKEFKFPKERFEKLAHHIEENYNGDIDAFLDNYYNVRETILTSIKDSDGYKVLQTMEMPVYKPVNTFLDRVTQNNIYNCENIGERFISIDLAKANFQVLSHSIPEIVGNHTKYEDFIASYQGDWYMADSKYSRQVIFGNLNPKRQITLQKYVMKQIADVLYNRFSLTPVSLSNDEVVYKTTLFNPATIDEIKAEIKEKVGDWDLHVEEFVLVAYELREKGKDKCVSRFFKKTFTDSHEHYEYKSIPKPFSAIVYKLLNKQEVEKVDRTIEYEGLPAVIETEFEIVGL